MELTKTLRQLIDEYGGDAVKKKVLQLVKKKVGRPSKKDDDRPILIRAAQLIENQSCQSVTAALKRACEDLCSPWRAARGENEQKQNPDERRLLERISKWIPDPENDDHEYFEAMVVLSDEVNSRARSNAMDQLIDEES
jgi:hypothetical protein